MDVTYGEGNDKIEIAILKTFANDAVARWDQRNNYMYTSYVWEWEILVNPQATSYRRTGVGKFAQQPVLPTQAHEVLRQKLLEARKILHITDGQGNTSITTPKTGDDTDQTGGPVPEFCNIISIEGDKSFIARWRIRSDISEADKWCSANSGVPAILSYTWTMVDAINERLQETFIYEARVVFNENYLGSNNASPDDFRSFFVPLPPAGFRRMDTHISQEEDGRTLILRVTDVSTRHAYRNWQGVVDVEVKNGQSVERSDPITGTALTGVNVSQIAHRETSRQQRAHDLNPWSVDARVSYTAMGDVFTAIVQGVARSSGAWSKWIVVRVWGSPETTQENLRFVARKVLIYRHVRAYGQGVRQAVFHTYNCEEVHDPVENFIELRWHVGTNVLANMVFSAITNATLFGSDELFLSQAFPIVPDDHIEGTDFRFEKRVPRLGIHLPGFGVGTRADSRLGLVSQVLKGICDAAGRPQHARVPVVNADPFTDFD